MRLQGGAMGFPVKISRPTWAAGVLSAMALAGAAARAEPGRLIRVLSNPNSIESESSFGQVLVPYRDQLLIVGAPHSDRDTSDSGLALLMDAESGEVIREFRNPTPRPQEEFGTSIAVSGHLVLIGAPEAFSEEADRTYNDEGKAYLFDGESGSLLLTLHNPAGTINNQFGEAVALLGPTPIVGAPFNNAGAFRS